MYFLYFAEEAERNKKEQAEQYKTHGRPSIEISKLQKDHFKSRTEFLKKAQQGSKYILLDQIDESVVDDVEDQLEKFGFGTTPQPQKWLQAKQQLNMDDVRHLCTTIFPITLPHFRLCEVVSLHMCVLPYIYRKILKMLLELMDLCEIMGCRSGMCTAPLSPLFPIFLPLPRLYQAVSLHMCAFPYIYPCFKPHHTNAMPL